MRDMQRIPNELVRTVAREYNDAVHMHPPLEGHYVEVNEAHAREVARIYENMPTLATDPYVKYAYGKLEYELLEQYKALLHAGFSFTFTEQDPYACSRDMMRDLAETKHIRVFSGGTAIHPYLDTMTPYGVNSNCLFRAVHDVFGHAAEGYQFGVRGEWNAWVHHSMMFTPIAQWALSTETLTQNCWFHYGPYAHLPVKDRPFATQKAVLLPYELVTYQRYLF